ncbi:MAG: RagB/SusD family nutrient uptake outer membrane protein [Bacteroidota bacterium]|nr:RagB/SusD family nutrient uptake outer membrane protein [Bacteroidota bacterium]UBZ14481.1 RagB/SusD family nutrient uptake outer membrane protein [Allomuricauda aquimarina]
MGFIENIKNKRMPNRGLSGNMDQGLKRTILLLFGIGLFGCSDFVEVGPPKNILISETVFQDPATVESAIANLFYTMREQGMVSGSYGLTTLMGIYSDDLDYYGFDPDYSQFYLHTVSAGNSVVLDWWSQAYYLIYDANDIIKGVEGSDALAPEEKYRFKGQALFVRAYVHSLLVSVYGNIPYITTTDYLENNAVPRLPVETVYDNIITDLTDAVGMLENVDDISGERVFPDQWAAKALAARMYLYTENWERAAAMATELIDAFSLEPDLEDVFLKESSETIWQLKPGDSPRNTQEANQLIIQFIPGQLYALTDNLLAAFESGDQRMVHWTGSTSSEDSTVTLHFAHKYKALFSETESVEYSILFRLAEQYLIRSEARVHLGDVSGAQQDLNAIRNRAGLANIGQNDLLGAILRERRVELFAEQGHRWFDLGRTENASELLWAIKPNWQVTDILLPIPESELEINPNLLPQNSGY